MRGTPPTVLAIVVSALLAPAVASAGDTLETWDLGCVDAEVYVGFDGLGRARFDKTLRNEAVVGCGLVERLSLAFSTTFQSNEYLSDGSGGLSATLFGTPLDTRYFDLDLVLDVGVAGVGLSRFGLAPGLELNVDSDPRMRGVGAWAVAALQLSGSDLTPEPTQSMPAPTADHEIALTVESGVGLYYRVAHAHELTVFYDMHFHPSIGAVGPLVEIGAVAFGYNVMLTDTLELITEISVDLSQRGSPQAVAATFGLIAALPSARR